MKAILYSKQLMAAQLKKHPWASDNNRQKATQLFLGVMLAVPACRGRIAKPSSNPTYAGLTTHLDDGLSPNHDGKTSMI